MNKKPVTILGALLLVCALAPAAWAQEDDASPKKKPVPKAVHEARAKAAAKKAKAKADADAKAKAVAIDLNRATKAQLKALPGLTDAQADAIIAKRPHRSKTDVVTKGIIPAETYQAYSKRIIVREAH